MRRLSFLALLLWPGLPLVYLLAPGHPRAWFSGLPISMVALGLGLVVALSAWCGCRTVSRVLWISLAVAVGVKVALALFALPQGLEASYFAGGDTNRQPERSSEGQFQGATRLDPTLDLVGDQFPVHFFNDFKRFNFYTASQPRRDLLPFAATWRGYLSDGTPGQRCFRLSATGTASARIGPLAALTVERASRLETREVCGELPPGQQQVEARYVRPQDGVPYLQLAERTAAGEYRPIEAERFSPLAASASEIEQSARLGWLARAQDLVVVLLCLLVVGRWLLRALPSRGLAADRPRLVERLVLSGSVLLAFGEALAANRPLAGRAAILSGGNDWLAYESYARDILFNGLLMTGGKPLGQGEAYYYQPFYPYFLAGVHLLLGEATYGVLIAQYLLVALAGLLTYYLAKELFGRAAGWAAFGLFWVLRYLVFDQIAGLLLSENLAAVIIPPMLLLLARWRRSCEPADLVGGGALLGLVILTRSTPLLFVPPALLLIWRAQRQKLGLRRPALGACGLFFGVTLAVFLLAPIRNYVVSGRPVLLPESTTTNIYETHRPSSRVNLSRINRDPLYDRLGLDQRSREVLEFIRQDPAGYVSSFIPMGLYPLGITGPALGTNQLQYELILLALLYLGALLLIPRARSGAAWFTHWFVLTHFVQMMIFMSHQYGFRLPMPMYAPMVAVAGLSLATLGGRAAALLPRAGGVWRGTSPRWALGSLVLLLACLWSGRQMLQNRDVEAEVFGLGGSASSATRLFASLPQSWQADRLFFDGQDGRSFGVAYLPGLAYREMKWLDSSQAFVWPAGASRAALAEQRDGNPRACPDGGQPSRGLLPLGGQSALEAWLIEGGAWPCAGSEGRLARFGGLLQLVSVRREPPDTVGQGAVAAAWRVVQRPSFGVRFVVESLDEVGAVRASSSAEPYAAGSWEPGELIVTRLRLDGATITSGQRLAVGLSRESSARLTIDDPLPLLGQTRVVVSE